MRFCLVSQILKWVNIILTAYWKNKCMDRKEERMRRRLYRCKLNKLEKRFNEYLVFKKNEARKELEKTIEN